MKDQKRQEIDHAAIARLEVNAFRRAWLQQIAQDEKRKEAKEAKKAARSHRRKLFGIF